jgi:hypothetical protein
MKKKKPIDPELKQILTELEEIVMRVGYKVRYEKGNFEGGYCVLKESSLIVVNSRSGMEKRISIVCRCLKKIGVDDIFVKPGIRKIIESESSKPVEKSADETEGENTDEESSHEESPEEELSKEKKA